MTLAEQITLDVSAYIASVQYGSHIDELQHVIEEAIMKHTNEYVEQTKRATTLSNAILDIFKSVTDEYKQKNGL
jgi:hypothetical protein